jgi:hypothetical protein
MVWIKFNCNWFTGDEDLYRYFQNFKNNVFLTILQLSFVEEKNVPLHLNKLYKPSLVKIGTVILGKV